MKYSDLMTCSTLFATLHLRHQYPFPVTYPTMTTVIVVERKRRKSPVWGESGTRTHPPPTNSKGWGGEKGEVKGKEQ